MRLLYGRLLFAALVGYIFIKLMLTLRSRLSPRLRSWCWSACFVALFLPLERGFIILLGDSLAWFNHRIITAGLSLPFVLRNILGMALMLLFLFWLVGSVVLIIKTRTKFKKARRAIVEKKLPLCASYFYRFRSHIYKPSDFEMAFTPEEQAMMLAHEKQHIAQHDPLLFRLLAIAECVFWFCPPVHKAATLFRQDRELLCDERVLSGYSKRDYCMMLLKASGKRIDGSQVVGIVSESSSVSERVETIITPVSIGVVSSVAVCCAAAAMVALGLPGFASITEINAGADYSVGQAIVSLSDNYAISIYDVPCIKGMEQFLIIQEDGIEFDYKNMYEYALSIGLRPEQRLTVQYLIATRPCLGEAVIYCAGDDFAISELQSELVYIPFDRVGRQVSDLIFRVI